MVMMELTPDRLEKVLVHLGAIVEAKSPFSMHYFHYAEIAREFLSCDPGRVLVFGAGLDTQMWGLLCGPGRVTVVEDDPAWFHIASRALEIDTILIKYTCKYGVRFIPDEAWVKALGDHVPFRSVLVDGPRARPHGRAQAIHYAAEMRSLHGSSVMVHDYHREGEERAHCNRFLGPPTAVTADPSGRELAYWRRP
jgi:hypothetical protein